MTLYAGMAGSIPTSTPVQYRSPPSRHRRKGASHQETRDQQRKDTIHEKIRTSGKGWDRNLRRGSGANSNSVSDPKRTKKRVSNRSGQTPRGTILVNPSSREFQHLHRPSPRPRHPPWREPGLVQNRDANFHGFRTRRTRLVHE